MESCPPSGTPSLGGVCRPTGGHRVAGGTGEPRGCLLLLSMRKSPCRPREIGGVGTIPPSTLRRVRIGRFLGAALAVAGAGGSRVHDWRSGRACLLAGRRR